MDETIHVQGQAYALVHDQPPAIAKTQDDGANGQEQFQMRTPQKGQEQPHSYSSQGPPSVASEPPHQYQTTDPGVQSRSEDMRHAAVVDMTGGYQGYHQTQLHPADIRNAFSGVPKVKPQWIDRYMKILVVGECGQGKTTFIKNLFASYAQDPDLRVNDAPAPTCRDVFMKNPNKLLTEIVVKDHSIQTTYHYRVQDTPGYENMEDNMDPILQYIKDSNQTCLEMEQDAKRAGPLAVVEDPRVDVCIYFIPPHRIKPIDVQFMRQLSEFVPVIPVLAKADSMTTDELESFRQTVRQKLHAASKDAGHPVVHSFSPEVLREAGAAHEVPPFAVVASNTVDLAVGRFWPVRKYAWGNCEAMSSVHSDLAALKKLLFEVSYTDLKKHTEERYYKFREGQLLNLDDATMPINRRTLTRHLHRLSRPKKTTLRSFFGTSLKYLASGVAFYVAANYLLGGRKRIEHDLGVVKEKTGEAINLTVEKAAEGAAAAVEKTGEAAHLVAAKTADAKDAVVDRLNGEAERRRKEEEARKKRHKFLGIF
ncbi:hypothetical protein WJX72_011182 [[Myrmecia] bisecta]|uniref:Septin-type G domain-containing protein n=1 Tax=[Myrmecia] bisecta TaxID=41462 RepID=A0AAW1Q7W0_9CHLO